MRRGIISMQQVNEITINEALDKFMNFQMAKGNAEDTLKYYETHCKKFASYLSKNNILKVEEIKEETVQEYVLYCKENNPKIKDISINTKLRAIRAFLYYLMKRGYLNSFDVTLKNAYKEPKVPYSDEDIKKLIKKPNVKKCTFVEYRNWVIVCHLLATGNRARTVRNIKNRNVDLKKRLILIDTTKNKKSYEVPISNDYYSILKEYMEIRKGNPDDFLFCTYEGKKFSSSGLRTAIENFCKERETEKHGLHLFRHLFAKAWIMSNGSPKKLQTAMGHETSYMIDEYLNIYGRELEEDFNVNTPLAQIKSQIKTEKISMK